MKFSLLIVIFRASGLDGKRRQIGGAACPFFADAA
jgi:hypothetical protein